MQKKIVVAAAAAAALAVGLGASGALAQGVQAVVQHQKAIAFRELAPFWQYNVHYHGIGVRVENPYGDPAFARRLTIVDLPPPFANLYDDRVPTRARVTVNGNSIGFHPRGGVLEAIVPAGWLDGIGPNDVLVEVWDLHNVRLGEFALDDCAFL